ncbi:50S ribosomal protein L13 [candidate division WOR-3 bacterium]|nr:50S ribosomal protein L13 [candidate division WOR-3 bacterium]MCK4575600.1 50S ribosomal protein L13 [candidate division WOR-3 bacterium]
MKTLSLRKEDVERKWYLVDAKGKTLGRLATKIATMLSGKDKPSYTPHVDNGDFIVVINAKDIFLSGQKKEQKMYYRYSGYIGGLKEITAKEMLVKHPERVITLAVKGMLPKNKLAARMLKRLKVYKDSKQPHNSQNPKPLDM